MSVVRWAFLALLLCSGWMFPQSSAPAVKGASRAPAADPQQLFSAGETALRENNLKEAEEKFRAVLAVDPGAAGAYANLGVIQMRRKQWPQALGMLNKAEKLAPKIAGIRLNIGLVYYRQKNYAAAIKPFESVVQQLPDSYQARYLLGFCYFLSNRSADAVRTLEPLWERVQAADQFNYLYVLGRAADNTKNAALEEKAYARLAEIANGTPEFRLIMGKSHLNRGEDDDAVRELEAAAVADPKLPFVHYYLGSAYLRKRDYERARTEFQEDLTIEPDVAFTYEQLGKVEALLQNEAEAARNFRQALKLDLRLIDARIGLAQIEDRGKRYPSALAQLDEVIRLDPEHDRARYLRGQVLLHMGREKEGRAELATAARMLNQRRAERQKELEGEVVPSPELTQEPQ